MHVTLGCVAIDQNSELAAVFGEKTASGIVGAAVALDVIALEVNRLNWECKNLRADLNLDVTKEACVLS